jgi:hypothetical protein
MQLIPRGRVLPEKLTDPQIVKKFPALYGSQRKYEQKWNHVGLLLMLTPAPNNSSFTGPQNIPPTTQRL